MCKPITLENAGERDSNAKQ